MEFTSVNKIFESAFKKNWLRPAISNYQGETLHFSVLSNKVKLSALKESPTTVSIDIKLGLALMRIPEGVDLSKRDSVEGFEKSIGEKIKSSLMTCIHKIRDGYGSDILSYGYLLYRAAPERPLPGWHDD